MRSILSAPCGGRPPIRIWGTVACALGGPGSAASTVAYQLNRARGAVAAGVVPRLRPGQLPDQAASVATTSYRQLHGWILLPVVICAVGAHVESRKGAGPGPTGSRWFPFPAPAPYLDSTCAPT